MTASGDIKAQGSFHASERVGLNAWVYGHADDPILDIYGGPLQLNGPAIHGESDPRYVRPMIVGGHTYKSISGAGSFDLSVKVPAKDEVRFRDSIGEDSWIDIEFTKNDVPYHTLRGLVDSVTRARSIGRGGVTDTVWHVVGRDLTKVFLETQVLFNHFAAENIAGAAVLRSQLFHGAMYGSGAPSEVVKAYLFGFLDVLGEYGRALWDAPPGMPGIAAGARIPDVIGYEPSEAADLPKRRAVNPNFVYLDSARLWQLAQEWSDPQFNELFVDLTDIWGRPLAPDPADPSARRAGWPRKSTATSVIFRERPFPHNTRGGRFGDSAWSKLPTATVQRGELAGGRIGRGGGERLNWIEVSPRLLQEMVGAHIQLQEPLVDVRSVYRHGVRRLLVTSPYMVEPFEVSDPNFVGPQLPATEVEGYNQLRQKLVQWYALNPYFWSGTLPLAHGRPDIRVGQRVHIPSVVGDDLDEWYYVEGVQHAFSTARLRGTLRSTLHVTRGWHGDETSLYADIQTAADRFRTPEPAIPGASGVAFQDAPETTSEERYA